MQILSTKLIIPPLRSRLVKRERLISKLNQSLECGFLLVSAPAGYGKTTLLSGWLSHSGLPTVWFSLDEEDNDPVRFLTYLAAALRTIDPVAGEILEAALQIAPLPAIDTLLTPVVNILYRLSQPFWLVLDDYHVIQNKLIHQIVSFLLEHRPEPFHLAIATRADPPLPLSRLRVRSQVVELRLSDLRFSIQETTEFMGRVMDLNLSNEDIDLINTRAEGWIAGLQMAGLSLQGREDSSGFIRAFSGENRYVLDFLFEEVFNRQSGDIQNFLLQTSILDRFCCELCDAITLRQDSQAILEFLQRSNLFLIPLDEHKQWFRYHNLFGDLVRNRFKHILLNEDALLHQRASKWYASANDLENAIAHALAAEDYETAAKLIEQITPDLDRHNKQITLMRWLDSLPGETLEKHPLLCVYCAWGYYWSGRREMEEKWLQMAEYSIEQSFHPGDPERNHIEGHIAAMRALASLTHEDIPRVLEQGQKSLDLLPDDFEMRCETAIAIGGAYWALGDVNETEHAFRMAQESALKVSSTMAVPSTCYIGIQQMKQGRLADAISTFREALRLATLSNGTETPVAGFPNTKLGDVLLERNDLVGSEQYLKKGLDQCSLLGQPDVLADAYACIWRYQRAVGELKEANESLQKAGMITQQAKVDPFVLTRLDECRLRMWQADSNLEAVNRWIQNSGLTPDGPLNYLHDLHHQNLARAMIMSGSRETKEHAAFLLERLLVAAEKAGWIQEQIKFLILQAVNDHTRDRTLAALQYLVRALILARPGGYVRVFLDEGESIRSMLVSLARTLRKGLPSITGQLDISLQESEADQLRPYITTLLSSFKEPGNPTETGFADRVNQAVLPVEPLSIRELEVLRLLAQGYSDKKIADKLVIARETVHKHLKNIYSKLDVHSRTEAIARASERGLF